MCGRCRSSRSSSTTPASRGCRAGSSAWRCSSSSPASSSPHCSSRSASRRQGRSRAVLGPAVAPPAAGAVHDAPRHRRVGCVPGLGRAAHAAPARLPVGHPLPGQLGTDLQRDLVLERHPVPFRHLWSLASRSSGTSSGRWCSSSSPAARARSSAGPLLVGVSLGVMVGTAIAYAAGWPTQFFNPFTMSMQSVNTTNFLYLSTFTRSSGLLLGAAMVFLWRPWRVVEPRREKAGRARPRRGWRRGPAVGRLLRRPCQRRSHLHVDVADGHAGVGRPCGRRGASVGIGFAFGLRFEPMVEIGKRSYGLYLWTWPISRICNAFTGSWSRFLVAMAIALPVSEACYRWVETPIRKGALGRWWKARERPDWRLITGCAAVSVLVLGGSLIAFYRSADSTFDAAADPATRTWSSIPNAIAHDGRAPRPSSSCSFVHALVAQIVPAPHCHAATLPRLVSSATRWPLPGGQPSRRHRDTFTVPDGSVEGCSVYDSGSAVSTRGGYTRNFSNCGGWDNKPGRRRDRQAPKWRWWSSARGMSSMSRSTARHCR